MLKLSLSIDDLLSLSTNMEEKSQDYVPSLKRHVGNRWVYKVSDYIVTIRVPKISQTSIQDLLEAGILTRKKLNEELKLKNRDILIGCTCNFWKWNGPDYNANENGYSQKVYSDLSAPDERDPNREFYLCKHARSALKKFKKTVKSI